MAAAVAHRVIARKVEWVVAVAPYEIEKPVVVALHTGLLVRLASRTPYLFHNCCKIAVPQGRKYYRLDKYEMTYDSSLHISIAQLSELNL